MTRTVNVTTVILLLGGGMIGCESTVFFRQPEPAVKYLAFGDSTTAGPSKRDYPDIVRELLSEPKEAFANEGESGEPTSEGLDRLQELFTHKIFPNAEFLLYWEGGNDLSGFIGQHDRFLLNSPDDPTFPFGDELAAFLGDVQANVEKAIRLSQQAGLQVFIATYFPLAPTTFVVECKALPFDIALAPQVDRANVYLDRLNERIRAAALSTGAQLVDLSLVADELQADRDNYFNCNHLSEAGNRIVAGLFAATLRP